MELNGLPVGSSLFKLINKTLKKAAFSDTFPFLNKNNYAIMYSCVPVPVNPPTVFLLALRDFTLPRSDTSSHHAGIRICLGGRISNEGNSQTKEAPLWVLTFDDSQ